MPWERDNYVVGTIEILCRGNEINIFFKCPLSAAVVSCKLLVLIFSNFNQCSKLCFVKKINAPPFAGFVTVCN